VNSWRKSFDVNRNMLFAISPAMNGSSQNDSAVQAQKRPAMLSEKVREVLRLKYSSFHQLWHKRRPGRADLQVSRSGGAAAPPKRCANVVVICFIRRLIILPVVYTVSVSSGRQGCRPLRQAGGMTPRYFGVRV